MRGLVRVGVMAIVASGLAVVGAAPPASADIVTAVDGTTITIGVTGEVTLVFGCSAGSFAINGTVPSPTVPCATLSKVSVSADASRQSVYGSTLNDFPANPFLVANMGSGDDYVIETDQPDQISMSVGIDTVQLDPPSAPNTSIDMGAGTDYIYAYGEPSADTFTATSTGTSMALATNVGGVATSYTVANVEALVVRSGAGNDTITTTGVTVASATDYLQLEGEAGDDTITNGPTGASIWGGTGSNVLTGGAGGDTFNSGSDTDVIAPGTGTDFVDDSTSLRSGGRTLSGGATVFWSLGTGRGDAVVRLRPAGADTDLLTASLARPGRQTLPAQVEGVTIDLTASGQPDDRGLADVWALTDSRNVTIYGDPADNDLADITLPEGSWTTSGTPGATLTFSTASAEFGNVTLVDIDDYRIHAPWSNKNRGFVYRGIRDLLFRFATDTELATMEGQLNSGTRTRAQLAAGWIDSDPYRSLDVERTFIKYLRRKADAGGLGYWITSLRNGKALWRFRAQLFGSSEYFTKAGGTNAQYVRQAYNDVLGRFPDPSGEAFWTNRLNSGYDRGSVALQFMNSAEARRRLVDDQFLRFLDRLPTPTEQDTWVAQIPSDTGELDLIAFLVNSSSYYNRT